MNLKESQKNATEGFELWRYGKRAESMEKLCQAYAEVAGSEAGDEESESRQQLLQGIERYFRILLKAEAIPTDEMAEIEAVFERRLGAAHEKTVTLCRRIAELSGNPAEKQRWYARAYENSGGGDLDSRDALQELRGERKLPFRPQPLAEPEGEAVQGDSILLLDGRMLKCLPKAEEDAPVDNAMELDTTGVYMTVGKGKNVKPQSDEPHPDRTAFLQNAFLLYESAETIFSDSRMFLAPVPIQSGLAYTGTSGFRSPTLGVYLEFWQRSGMPVTIKKGIYPFAREHRALLYHIAGSPLSGSNSCAFVTADGTTLQHSLSSFGPYWKLFVQINSRYDEAKRRFQAYTIREVVEKLK